MTPLHKMQSMFKSAQVPFKELVEGGNVVLRAALPRNRGTIVVSFADKGENFHSAAFSMKKSADKCARYNGFAVFEESDIEALFEMIEGSPHQLGEVFYAETEDGSLCAAVYVPKGSDLGVFFICETETGKFLGLMGAELQ